MKADAKEEIEAAIGSNDLLVASEAPTTCEKADVEPMVILPCPFCGELDITNQKTLCECCTTGYFVECNQCGCRTAAWSTWRVAFEYWNARAKCEAPTACPETTVHSSPLVARAGCNREPGGVFHCAKDFCDWCSNSDSCPLLEHQ